MPIIALDAVIGTQVYGKRNVKKTARLFRHAARE
jgi:hypothetical protein